MPLTQWDTVVAKYPQHVLWYHCVPLKMYCKKDGGCKSIYIYIYICQKYSVFKCAFEKPYCTICMLCMYIFISIPSVLMFNYCTFPHDCFEYDTMIDRLIMDGVFTKRGRQTCQTVETRLLFTSCSCFELKIINEQTRFPSRPRINIYTFGKGRPFGLVIDPVLWTWSTAADGTFVLMICIYGFDQWTKKKKKKPESIYEKCNYWQILRCHIFYTASIFKS